MGDGQEGMPSAEHIAIRLPDEPPALTPGAARALLRLLLAEAQNDRPSPPPDHANGQTEPNHPNGRQP